MIMDVKFNSAHDPLSKAKEPAEKNAHTQTPAEDTPPSPKADQGISFCHQLRVRNYHALNVLKKLLCMLLAVALDGNGLNQLYALLVTWVCFFLFLTATAPYKLLAVSIFKILRIWRTSLRSACASTRKRPGSKFLNKM